jgi:hypothetical protein
VSRAARLVACLLLLAGCRSPLPLVPLPADDLRPQAYLAAWAERAHERRALRGLARLSVDGDEVELRSKQILIVERPARLRVEILGLLNQAVAVLVINGSRFELFRAEDRSVERGDVRPGLLWEVAGLDLTPQETVALLLGAPDPDASLRVVRALAAGDDEIRLDLADAGGVVRRRIGFDGEGRLRWLEQGDGGGAMSWRAHFDDYELVQGSPVAHAITLDVAAGQTHAELSLRDVELNPELPPDIFRLRLRDSGDGGTREGG